MCIKLHHILTQTGTGIVYVLGQGNYHTEYTSMHVFAKKIKKKKAMVNIKIKLVFGQKLKCKIAQ